jgi:diguanylate cyclase (GGDEF)-like protein
MWPAAPRGLAAEISEKYMNSLLKHVVDMTGHRDHAMLDVSVVCAVRELSGAVQVRMLAIARVRGRQFVRARASAGAGGAARIEEPQDGALPGEPLASLPQLEHCLASRGDSAEAAAADGTRTLWLPIWVADQADTCLEISCAAPFSPDQMNMIGGILSVYRNFQNLLDYSERDSLTGLLNRKTFDDQLARMLQSAGEPDPPRPGQPERRRPQGEQKQWLAVVDVDHFKLVNDRFGHLYGDEVLILIANLLQSSFRANDRVFRFGGEEFVVLLRSTTLEHAQRIIDRFRTRVEAHDFPQVGTVTVSVGFVAISAAESPVVTLGHADQALYYAKSHGRNQACHYGQLLAAGLLQPVARNGTVELF